MHAQIFLSHSFFEHSRLKKKTKIRLCLAKEEKGFSVAVREATSDKQLTHTLIISLLFFRYPYFSYRVQKKKHKSTSTRAGYWTVLNIKVTNIPTNVSSWLRSEVIIPYSEISRAQLSDPSA